MKSVKMHLKKLKAVLKSSPILVVPNIEKPFKLAVDACDVGAGAVLLQEDINGVDHLVRFFQKVQPTSETLFYCRKVGTSYCTGHSTL